MGVDGPCWATGIPEIPGTQDGRSRIERLIAGARKKEQDWGGRRQRPPRLDPVASLRSMHDQRDPHPETKLKVRA
jgi:hypothetical protein